MWAGGHSPPYISVKSKIPDTRILGAGLFYRHDAYCRGLLHDVRVVARSMRGEKFRSLRNPRSPEARENSMETSDWAPARTWTFYACCCLGLLVGKAQSSEPPPVLLIGYTEGRNDLKGGQFLNWKTQRACVVQADGAGRKVLAEELTKQEHAWTQFAGWSPDGTQAVILSLWESPENAAWEREHKTFRMTEGWLVDTCLFDHATGAVANLTAVERVSIYNTGLFFLPDGSGYGFTPLIHGVSKPYLMDRDGRNKRDVSGSGGGFAYGYSASPDGKQICYHENYQIYVSNTEGRDKRRIETGNAFNFGPRWSPDGEWILFVSGEHYNCHPHIVKKDGSGLKQLADRGGYSGVVEVLAHPDFHSASSDLPVWSVDGRHLFYTAQVEESIELMRVDLDGEVTQLTKSKPGTRHYHPAVAPDGKRILFGSDRTGTMQLYVATTDGQETRPITNVPAGHCAMHGHWQPVAGASLREAKE